MTRVFVYGSLRRGLHNHHFLADATLVGDDATEPAFTLYSLGAFPAMVQGGTTSVVGEVYEVDARTLAALDRLEGHPHFYQRVAVTLRSGAEVETYVVPSTTVRGRGVVAGGDWRRWDAVNR